LIFALLIAALVLYFRFQSANRITQQTRKEYQTLQSEFDEHRQRTRENETKLKRDLQTEINRVEELKGKSGSGS
jgi:septal ring factor EnvC (AmiA/AmiB activator)